MNNLQNNAAELLLLLFLIITFLQSGIDKVLDWNGNITWLKGHFEKTFLKNCVKSLVVVLIVFEIISGLLCVYGAIQIITINNSFYAFNGAILSSITLLMLLFGQRVAKDYEGARSIVLYLITTVFLVFLLQLK